MTDAAGTGVHGYGQLSSVNGRGVVRIELLAAAPAAEVWAAATVPRRLAAWYGTVEGDLHVGGSYRALLFPSGWDGTGRVLACDPGRRLLVESAEPGQQPVTDHLELTAESTGSTRVVLTKTGVPVSMIAAYGVGTQIHLENLAAHLAGQGPVDPDLCWAELLPRFEQLAKDL